MSVVRRRPWSACLSAAGLVGGLTLTLAATTVGSAPAGPRPSGSPTLGQLLGAPAQAQPDPMEEMAAQQAFAARHYGAAGLGSPTALSRQIQQGVAQSRQVRASSSYRHRWLLRGPSSYFANDRSRSGSLVNLGEQNLAGRVTSVATSPKRPAQVWLGTAGGGAWRSDDAGKHWAPKFDRQGVLAVGAIAVDPTQPNRVFVGTGEANTNADAYYGNGMYVSDNGGRRWHHARLRGVLAVFHIEAVPPSKGYPKGRVFAATTNGLWLSTDRGRHYRNVSLPTNVTTAGVHKGVYHGTPFGNFVTDVRVRPKHPTQVVAVVGWRRGSAMSATGKPESVGNGFYQSTRSGKRGTWKFVPQDPVTGLGVPNNNANNSTPSSDPIGRTSLAYSADGTYLWAVVQDAGNFNNEVLVGGPLPAKNTVLNGVYVSTSGSPGKDWVPKGNTQTFGSAPGSGLIAQQAALYGPGVQSWYDQWIAVDPADDQRVLVGLEEVYEAVANQTTPAGKAEWRTVSRYWNGCALLSAVDCSTIPGPAYAGKTTHPDQHAAAFVTDQGGTTTLYTGNDGGIFSQDAHATDAGYQGYDNSSWRWLNLGLATTQPYYAVEGSDGTVYAGLQDNGEVKIEPKSTRGDEVYGGDGFDTAVVPGNSNTVYEEYTYGAMRVSTDGGHNWKSIANCNVSSTTAQFSTPFLLDPRNPLHVVEVGRYIDESVSGAATIGDDVQQGKCAQRNGGWKTAYDLGASRVATKPGVSGGGVNNIATAVAVSGTHLYVPFCGICDPISQGAGKLGYFHNGIATNVQKGCTAVTGGSACWHKAKAKGLPNRYVQGVAIDPRNPRKVYVALSGYLRRWFPNPNRGGSVYVSTNAGDTFHNVSGNLPRVPANALALRNGQVFVGTDQGVFSARPKGRRTHWSRVGRGLPNASALDLRLNPQGSHLVVATHGRGVWTYDFGSAAKAPYRQKGLRTAPPPSAPAPPAGSPRVQAVDPRLLAAGLALLLMAGVVRRTGRHRPVAAG